MEAKHTPGPWTSVGNSWDITTIYDANKDPVCKIDIEDWGVTESNQNDLEMRAAEVARVIEAAPDLLGALTEVMQWIDGWDPPFTQDDEWPDAERRARAAILKATGSARQAAGAI